jgi:hypothetical protein
MSAMLLAAEQANRDPTPEVVAARLRSSAGIGDPLPSTRAVVDASAARALYAPPRLEALGVWSALTLQQSIGIGPGDF